MMLKSLLGFFPPNLQSQQDGAAVLHILGAPAGATLGQGPARHSLCVPGSSNAALGSAAPAGQCPRDSWWHHSTRLGWLLGSREHLKRFCLDPQQELTHFIPANQCGMFNVQGKWWELVELCPIPRSGKTWIYSNVAVTLWIANFVELNKLENRWKTLRVSVAPPGTVCQSPGQPQSSWASTVWPLGQHVEPPLGTQPEHQEGASGSQLEFNWIFLGVGRAIPAITTRSWLSWCDVLGGGLGEWGCDGKRNFIDWSSAAPHFIASFCRADGHAIFKLTYLSNHDYKHLYFESDAATVNEIVLKVSIKF
ncbi:hypothetical protein IHE44_0007305 [Lamprotornis superbus]|uniref:Uncharacterized protein n=1 Tax=Lamprotornis superbus TaxID=245042 RepID=A0A835NX08_9PASS|nr:hypothetical protein IHE44_0007305 [Lamprotornis superbus]